MSRAWITQEEGSDRRVYRFHQSWIDTTDKCLEQARLGLIGELPQTESGEAALGTACHHAFEMACIDLEGVVAPEPWYRELAQDKFTELIAQPHFKWAKKKEAACRNYIDWVVTEFYNEVLPKLDPLAVEHYFGPHAVYEDDNVVIQLAGSIDCVDRRRGVLDWKTGSKFSWAGKDWEKDRWSIQAAAYTFGADMEGFGQEVDTSRFTFVVFRDDRQLQIVELERNEGHWLWLVEKMKAIVELAEAQLSVWPKNDNHALCSPIWCAAWERCKGQFVSVP